VTSLIHSFLTWHIQKLFEIKLELIVITTQRRRRHSQKKSTLKEVFIFSFNPFF
jgi:hypothetical protein